MKPITQLSGQRLKWIQPNGWKQAYELQANDEPAATLRFKSAWGSLATGESADGTWTFKRVGFIRTRVTIRTRDADAEIAEFVNNTWSGGGTLNLDGGRSIRATSNFWQSKLEFQTEAGVTLLTFQRGGVVHLSAVVEIAPEASRLAELPWLVMLGWYLVVMMSNDSAGAAAAAAAG